MDTKNPATAERYRQAAQDALEQLDWCIGYLHGIRKTRVSAVLARNRRFIRQSLLHEPAEATPTDATDGAKQRDAA